MENVNFRNVGKKQQHPVTLVGVAEGQALLFEDDAQTKSTFVSIMEDLRGYLNSKGFDNPTDIFCVVGGAVIRYEEGQQHPAAQRPLWAAIQERDHDKGQTGEYLAAIALTLGLQADGALANYRSSNKSDDELLFFIVETAMQVQMYHMQLFLLENVHAQYSAGKSRTAPARDARTSPYKLRARQLVATYMATHSKERSYQLAATELQRLHFGQHTPAAGTIKDWFKSELAHESDPS